MKFLFASDSFKGTLSSERITQLLEAAAGRTFPGCETAGVPVADGGEGTIDAVISALNGTYRRLTVHGPLMEEAQSFYGEFEGDSAIIEMAAASGLPMVPADRRNPPEHHHLWHRRIDKGCPGPGIPEDFNSHWRQCYQ